MQKHLKKHVSYFTFFPVIHQGFHFPVSSTTLVVICFYFLSSYFSAGQICTSLWILMNICVYVNFNAHECLVKISSKQLNMLENGSSLAGLLGTIKPILALIVTSRLAFSTMLMLRFSSLLVPQNEEKTRKICQTNTELSVSVEIQTFLLNKCLLVCSRPVVFFQCFKKTIFCYY